MRYELTRSKYLSDSEQQQLNAVLDKYKDTNLRDTTLIWLALYTGARATELLNITKSDLHDDAVFIRGIKKSDNREIPIPRWLFQRVSTMAKSCDDRLFPLTYNGLRYIWNIYRPINKTFHSLRHTFAINLYRKCKDVRLLQVALGHRSWGNTMIYAAYQYKTDDLRRAILGK